MNIGRFVTYLKHQKRYSPKTVLAYENDLAQFFNYLKKTYPSIQTEKELELDQIRSWIVDLITQKYEASSIHRKVSTLQSYFKFLLKEKIVDQNPTTLLQLPKKKQKLPIFWEADKMNELLDNQHFTKDFKGRRDRLMVEMLYVTGIRRSELITLENKNVDLDRQNIRIVGKGNKERLLPIGIALQQSIMAYRSLKNNYFEEHSKEFDSKWLFVTDKGTKLYPKLVYNTVRRYLSLITNHEHRSPHTLRHTIATTLLNNGSDLNAVKTFLGHSSLAATQIYTHNTIEKIKKAYQKAHPRA